MLTNPNPNPSLATTESVLWKWLDKASISYRTDLHMTRVENAVGPGWPDVEGMLVGTQFFIELKCAYRPVYANTEIQVKFRPKQPPWHRRRLLAGARIFVLLQVGKDADACRYLISSQHIEDIKAGLLETDLAQLAVIDPRSKARAIVDAAAYGAIVL